MEKKDAEFSTIYDGMNALYSKVEDMMGSVYIRIKSNPKDDDARIMLDSLNEIAQSILYLQMAFVENYCDKKVVGVLMGAIKDKVDGLGEIKKSKMNR